MEDAGGLRVQAPDPLLAARVLLAGLRRRGFTLTASPDPHRLFVAPWSALTDADRAALALHREALLDLLWDERPDSIFAVGWPDDPRPVEEEWDEETQRYVSRPRPVVLASYLVAPPPEPAEPPAGVPVVPPPDAALVYQDRKGRPCHADGRVVGRKDRLASEVTLWAWAGAPCWYHAALHPPPAPAASEDHP